MYPVVLYPLPEDEGGGWFAEIPDLPGCASDGPTPAEALKAVEEAQEAWLAVARERGFEVPHPAGDGHRVIALRLPESVYNHLAMKAFAENRPHRVGDVAAGLIEEALPDPVGCGDRIAAGPDVLHVYGQALWHQDVYLVGNRRALRKLRAAVTAALNRGRGSCETFANDGEGYDVHVVCVDDPATLDKLAVPYHGKHAREASRDAVWPDRLLPGQPGAEA
ncbi:MAG: type II toxin-antitoxin system HicB family antitoxin [Bacillota bacterium]